MAGKGSAKESQSKPAPTCRVVLCEDPNTGEILAKGDGNCPDGFIERYRDKCREGGITFVIPKVRTREE
jgi:hypothetical protein